jgi:uncharacterized protein (DUF302 family)
MQSDQTVGIDLPLKMLVWQDAGGQVWLTPHRALDSTAASAGYAAGFCARY